MKLLILKSIRFYQNTLSLLFKSVVLSPSSCRFIPTCSEYTYQAVDKYGTIRGLFLGLKRFITCHPWGGKGMDPLK